MKRHWFCHNTRASVTIESVAWRSTAGQLISVIKDCNRRLYPLVTDPAEVHRRYQSAAGRCKWTLLHLALQRTLHMLARAHIFRLTRTHGLLGRRGFFTAPPCSTSICLTAELLNPDKWPTSQRVSNRIILSFVTTRGVRMSPLHNP